MNKQSCLFYSCRLHLTPITCMLPSLAYLCFVLICPLSLFTYSLCCFSVPLYPPASLPIGPPGTLLRPLPPTSYPPMIPLLLSLPCSKCPLILVDDPLNSLSLSNHSYSHACPGTYANTHAYTHSGQPHSHRHG